MSTTNIEKDNLEAHVELCAERYKAMEDKLDSVEEKVVQLETTVGEIKTMIVDMKDHRNNQLGRWGMSAIGALVAIIGWLIVQFVLN